MPLSSALGAHSKSMRTDDELPRIPTRINDLAQQHNVQMLLTLRLSWTEAEAESLTQSIHCHCPQLVSWSSEFSECNCNTQLAATSTGWHSGCFVFMMHDAHKSYICTYIYTYVFACMCISICVFLIFHLIFLPAAEID